MTRRRGSFLCLFYALGVASGLPAAGPDVIVGDLQEVGNYGSAGGIDAFSVGTTSCNIGDEPLDWVDGTSAHPVIAQNMYRLKDGRFEQIGMSWLKHGFAALQEDLCDPDCRAYPDSSALGVGCSDPYGASLNGAQPSLGPRWEVNPATGEFPFPPDDPTIAPTIGRRLQVHVDDLDPTLNRGARWYVEGHYIHPQDAAAGHGDNNVAYRPISIDTVTAGVNFSAEVTGETTRESPSIYAWQVEDSEVEIAVLEVAGDGRFYAGSRVTDNGDGTWHYEYAIYNMNSKRAAGSFTVPLPLGAVATSAGFHDVDYHSGEPYDLSDWEASVTGARILWSTAETYAEDELGNALRWGTLYNFRFDCDAAPTTGTLRLGLFEPGTDDEVTFAGPHPGGKYIAPVEHLQCIGMPDGVQISWFNGAAYTELELHRNGDLLEVLPAGTHAYFDEDAPAREARYTVYPFAGEDPALESFCDGAPLSKPGTGFVYEAESKSAGYDYTDGSGAVRSELRILEDRAHAGYPSPIAGFSMSLVHDPFVLRATAVTLGDDLEAVNGGDGPDYFAPELWENGITAGVLVDFELGESLITEDPREVLLVHYALEREPFIGYADGAVTVLEWREGFGTPRITNTVVVGLEPEAAGPLPGIISLVGSDGAAAFLRGDLDGSGQLVINDAVQLLTYMFADGEVACVDAGDLDDNGVLIINDAIRLLNYLFSSGTEPEAPFPDCGGDPTTEDALSCVGPVPACD